MDNFIIYVGGKKGSGKTTLVKKLLIKKFDRVVCLDPNGYEYKYLTADSLNELIELLKANYNRKFFRISYQPFDQRDDEFFEVVSKVPNICIVVDEADLYSSAYKENEEFKKLIRYGRHKRQSLIIVSRRPAEISRNVTAQSDIVISFRQTEPRDLEYFRKISGDWEKLTKLSVYKYPEKPTENKHFLILTGKDFYNRI